jgi:hypothetical protein
VSVTKCERPLPRRGRGSSSSRYVAKALQPDADWAFNWLRAHNALVRFESDGTVSVTVCRTKRRRTILVASALQARAAAGVSSTGLGSSHQVHEREVRA